MSHWAGQVGVCGAVHTAATRVKYMFNQLTLLRLTQNVIVAFQPVRSTSRAGGGRNTAGRRCGRTHCRRNRQLADGTRGEARARETCGRNGARRLDRPCTCARPSRSRSLCKAFLLLLPFLISFAWKLQELICCRRQSTLCLGIYYFLWNHHSCFFGA